MEIQTLHKLYIAQCPVQQVLMHQANEYRCGPGLAIVGFLVVELDICEGVVFLQIIHQRLVCGDGVYI